jgi:hypothetical protein
MRNELEARFKELYPNYRILAVQLNGFSHKVFFDGGTASSKVEVEYHSPHLSAYERTGLYTDRAKQFLEAYPTYAYQGNAKEIVFINPEER